MKVRDRMRILITAGGTYETIDDVRTIKNKSTGRLGQLIADAFDDENIEIDYIHGDEALLPNREVNLYPIKDVRDLERVMRNLLETNTYYAVIHAMAVSDYEIYSVSTIETMSKSLGGMSHHDLKDALEHYQEDLNRFDKIASEHDDLVVLMRKAPKIINMVKRLQKDTILVGFKLVVDSSREELKKAVHQLMDRNDCDYVLGNDLKDIGGDRHKGYLFQKDLSYQVYYTKQEIAEAIKERVLL